MKSIISVIKTFIACTFVIVSSSAIAQMQIQNVDLTGLPVPGGVCTSADAWFTSGQFQIMVHEREDGNGGTHFTFREQIKGGAIIDSNGDTYRISGNAHQVGPFLTSEQETSGGNTVVHDTWNIRVTPTKGSGGERYWLKGRLHVVIDSEGNVNVINNQIEAACEG